MGEADGGGLKSAWEVALERLDSRGIERPREEKLDEELRRQIAEIRSRAEASLAELEILHRDARAGRADPGERAEAEEEYHRERQRIEERRDARIAALRRKGPDQAAGD